MTILIEAVQLTEPVKTSKKKTKKRLDLSEPKPSPEKGSFSPRGWVDGSTDHFSLKDIMEEESKSNPKKVEPKVNFTPIRRKQAKAQDLIRREKEQTIELAKSPSLSPWGKARPVKVNDPFPEPVTEQFPTLSTSATHHQGRTGHKTKFEDIVKRQEAAEVNRKTRYEKSLDAIEIEERAIQELNQYYKQLFPSDIVSVTRVNKQVSVPLWTKSWIWEG